MIVLTIRVEYFFQREKNPSAKSMLRSSFAASITMRPTAIFSFIVLCYLVSGVVRGISHNEPHSHTHGICRSETGVHVQRNGHLARKAMDDQMNTELNMVRTSMCQPRDKNALQMIAVHKMDPRAEHSANAKSEYIKHPLKVV